MGMIKKEATAPESGATAAIERLSKPTEVVAAAKPAYKQRTQEDIGRRIVVQGAYQHAAISPALAGLRFDDLAGYEKLVEEFAQWIISRVEANS